MVSHARRLKSPRGQARFAFAMHERVRRCSADLMASELCVAVVAVVTWWSKGLPAAHASCSRTLEGYLLAPGVGGRGLARSIGGVVLWRTPNKEYISRRPTRSSGQHKWMTFSHDLIKPNGRRAEKDELSIDIKLTLHFN